MTRAAWLLLSALALVACSDDATTSSDVRISDDPASPGLPTGAAPGDDPAGCLDADRDGYWTGCAAYTDPRPGPDCDDGDAGRFQALTGYADQDLDGFTAGPLRTLCATATLPIELRATASAASDCNDADPALASDCATCRDDDGDGAFTGCDQYALRVGPDCDDGDPLVAPGTPELPDDGKDNDCAGDGDGRALAGTGIFVAITGSDGAAGTRAQPKRTIRGALLATNPSGRIYVAGGTYDESPIPNLDTQVSLFGGYQPGNWDVRNPAQFQTRFTWTVKTSGERRVVIDGVTVSTQNTSIAQAAQTFVSRSTFTSADGILAAGASLTLVQCTFQVAIGSVSPVTVDGGQLVAVGNTISGSSNGARGIVVRFQSRARLARNVIDLGRGVETGQHDGILVWAGSSAIIERNLITVDGGPSAAVRGGGDGNTMLIRGNTFVSRDEMATTATGVDVGADVALVVGNVFRDDGAKRYLAVNVNGGADGRRAHVELIGNVIAPRRTRLDTGVRVGGAAEVTAIDNIIALHGSGNAVEVVGGSASVGLYHNDLLAPVGCLLASASGGDYCALDAADVNGWRRDDGASRGNLSVAPRFVDAAGDFHLRADSPLIDRGYDVVAGDGRSAIDRSAGPLAASLIAAQLAATDVDGQPRSGAWDIGLDEVR